jgi:hypothetical protein
MVIPEPAPAPQQVLPPQAVPPDEVAMCISAAAYSGSPSDSTISLLLKFSKAYVVALADTGSTSTLMDLAFAQKHKIPLTSTEERTVKVAGGGTLASVFIAYNCPFTLQGTKFVTNFRILELQGADVILGVNWFKQHNPVTFDFVGRELTIGVHGKLLTFKDHLLPADKLLISSDQCSKLLAQGATGYLLCYTQVGEVQEDNTTDVHLMLSRNCYCNSRIYLRHQKDYHLLENMITTFPCYLGRNHQISNHIECLTVKKLLWSKSFRKC